MAGYNCQEAFKTFPPSLDNLIREPVGEHLARKRRDVHAGRLAFQDIAECLKIRVTPAHNGVTKLESRYVGLCGRGRVRKGLVESIEGIRYACNRPCTRSHNRCTSSDQNLYTVSILQGYATQANLPWV